MWSYQDTSDKSGKLYRSEWKYTVNKYASEQIKSRIGAVLEHDPHALSDGTYIINSLYFDDVYNSCAKENEAGDRIRFKYRIRYYNDNSDYIVLERKEKYNGYCHKASAVITREEYDSIINNDFDSLLWDNNKRLLTEFALDIMTRGFSPKVIIKYQREAFVEPITNIRVTFDDCVSASDDIDNFLESDINLYPIIDADRSVLEVKHDDVLPAYILDIVTGGSALTQQAFSKYYMGRKTMQEIRGLFEI